MLEREARLARVAGLERGLDLLEAIGERGGWRRRARGRRDERAVGSAAAVHDDPAGREDDERERQAPRAREEAPEAIERAGRREAERRQGVARVEGAVGEGLGVLERLQEGGRRREAVLARLLERLQHDLLERDGDVHRRVGLTQARRRVREVHRDELDLVVRLERLPPREHLVEDDPRRVDVRPGVDDLGERLLRREVLGRPEDHARLREGRRAGAAAPRHGLRDLGDPEVEDLHDVGLTVALDEHDVVGLEIAVDDPGAVRVLEAAQDLAGDGERALLRQRAGLDDVRERLAREELHGEEELALAGAAEVRDGDDVRVLQAARRLGLALEAARELVLAAQLRQQDLDGEILAHHRVLGAIDGAHAAHAEAAHDAVALADDGADERIDDGRAAARAEGVLELDLP